MTEKVSIVMPAYEARQSLPKAVRSVIGQTHGDWELLIVSDDGHDYEAVLRSQGISDRRCRFLTTGVVGSGAGNARNRGLEAVDSSYVAVLDADDRFKRQKLERAVAALEHHAIVSCALDVVDSAGAHLRSVGAGKDRPLAAGAHKWVNFSMDSMIVWDRRRCDARYDPGLANFNDFDFLMRLYRTSAGSFHIGEPLHDYVKLKTSLSNGAGVTERMIASKTRLLQRLAEGFYAFADPGAVTGITDFLTISLAAERSYPAALSADANLLFEDHLEPLLSAASTSAA